MYDSVDEAWCVAHDVLAQSTISSLLESFGGGPADSREREVAEDVVSAIVSDRERLQQETLKHVAARAAIADRYVEALRTPEASPETLVDENVKTLQRAPGAHERVADPMREMRRGVHGVMRGGGEGLSRHAVTLLSGWLRVIARCGYVRVD